MHQSRFYYRVLTQLIGQRLVDRKAKIVVICAGQLDAEILQELGFTHVLLTSISKYRGVSKYKFKQCDAHKLPFRNDSFDFALVHAGLHHCYSPHQVLGEMYRVARKGVLVCEAQDNLFTRLLVKLRLTEEYEFSAVAGDRGGVNDLAIPNYVYRWSQREVEKTIRSLDYAREPRILYFAEFNFPNSKTKDGQYGRELALVSKAFADVANKIVPGWGNLLGFFIDKQHMRLHPWI